MFTVALYPEGESFEAAIIQFPTLADLKLCLPKLLTSDYWFTIEASESTVLTAEDEVYLASLEI